MAEIKRQTGAEDFKAGENGERSIPIIRFPKPVLRVVGGIAVSALVLVTPVSSLGPLEAAMQVPDASRFVIDDENCRYVFSDAVGPPAIPCEEPGDASVVEVDCYLDFSGKEASTGKKFDWVAGVGPEWCDNGVWHHATSMCEVGTVPAEGCEGEVFQK